MRGHSTRPDFVLHADVNKCVLMMDPAGGKSVEDICNEIIAEKAYGFVEGDNPVVTDVLKDDLREISSYWKIVSTEPTLQPPAHERPLMCFKEFIKGLLPLRSPQQASMSSDERMAYTKAVKRRRTQLVATFTNPGSPGAALRPFYDDILGKLHLSADRQQRYVLLPAFFDLLLHLCRRDTPFRVGLVFRTFGDDLRDVLDDVKRFCQGKHPAFPDAQIPVAFRSNGVFFRNGPTAGRTHLVWGTTQKPPSIEEGLSFYEQNHPQCRVVSGFSAIFESVGGELFGGEAAEATAASAAAAGSESALAPLSVCGIRDYFEWWAANQESADSGKLFLVPSADAANAGISVMMDDNALHNIVDVRRSADGGVCELEHALDRHIIAVDPFQAIVNRSYFIDAVEQCVRNQLEVPPS